MEDTLQDVPAEQLILGMPFYTRVWSETPIDGDGSTGETDNVVDYALSSYAAGMSDVQ